MAPKNALVWVAGGRDYKNRERMYQVLDEYNRKHGIKAIITGACRRQGSPPDQVDGADGLAEQWAREREIPYIGVPAQWRTTGKLAGPMRNYVIADGHLGIKPDVLLAFPGGRGTTDAIEEAERHLVPVFKITDTALSTS